MSNPKQAEVLAEVERRLREIAAQDGRIRWAATHAPIMARLLVETAEKAAQLGLRGIPTVWPHAVILDKAIEAGLAELERSAET